MKTSLKAGVFGVLALASFAPAALADDDAGPFSGGVTLTSDYRFRGVSQTDRGAADPRLGPVRPASGFFANIWASNDRFQRRAPTYELVDRSRPHGRLQSRVLR